MTENSKNNPIPNAKQFTSSYQPSPSAKSKGAKKYWEYRKARQKFFEELCDIKLPNGKTGNFWVMVKEKLQQMIFDKEIDINDYVPSGEGFTFLGNKLTAKERTDLIMKLISSLMPEDKNFNVKHSGDIILNFDKEDSDL
jgi:hypothetical protein